MSIAGGVDRAIERGAELGCETVQIFTKNATRWKGRALREEEVVAFREKKDASGIDPVFAHGSYLINLASPDGVLWERSLEALVDELERCVRLGLPYLVLHPGSHKGAGVEAGLGRVVEAIDAVCRRVEGVVVLLENTAGQGTALGVRWEEWAWVLDRVQWPERVGFCFDTSHAHAAGYDLRTPEGYEAVWGRIEELVGVDRVRVVHLNDAARPLGSRVDRHTHIGQGELGLEPFHRLLHDPRLADRPMVLETPKGDGNEADRENLRVLRSLRDG